MIQRMSPFVVGLIVLVCILATVYFSRAYTDKTGQSGKMDAQLQGSAASDSYPESAIDSLGEGVLSANDLVLFARIQDGYELVIRQFDRNDSNRMFEGELEIPQSTAYRIHDVCARQSNELYLAGYSQAGDLIIERWTLAEPAGVRFLHIEASMLPPGSPLPPLPNIQQGIAGGGAYVAVASRGPGRRVQRSELMRMPMSAPPRWIIADPEGRYLVYCAGQPMVIIQRYYSGSVVELCSEQSLPILKQVYSFGLAQHGSLGRVLHLEAMSDQPGAAGEPVHILFSDQENTSVFSPVQVLTHSEWTAQGFEGAVWYRPSLSVWDTE